MFGPIRRRNYGSYSSSNYFTAKVTVTQAVRYRSIKKKMAVENIWYSLHPGQLWEQIPLTSNDDGFLELVELSLKVETEVLRSFITFGHCSMAIWTVSILYTVWRTFAASYELLLQMFSCVYSNFDTRVFASK
jgi:hypothetical protein